MPQIGIVKPFGVVTIQHSPFAIGDRVQRLVSAEEELTVVEGDRGISPFLGIHCVASDFFVLIAGLEDAGDGRLVSQVEQALGVGDSAPALLAHIMGPEDFARPNVATL